MQRGFRVPSFRLLLLISLLLLVFLGERVESKKIKSKPNHRKLRIETPVGEDEKPLTIIGTALFPNRTEDESDEYQFDIFRHQQQQQQTGIVSSKFGYHSHVNPVSHVQFSFEIQSIIEFEVTENQTYYRPGVSKIVRTIDALPDHAWEDWNITFVQLPDTEPYSESKQSQQQVHNKNNNNNNNQKRSLALEGTEKSYVFRSATKNGLVVVRCYASTRSGDDVPNGFPSLDPNSVKIHIAIRDFSSSSSSLPSSTSTSTSSSTSSSTSTRLAVHLTLDSTAKLKSRSSEVRISPTDSYRQPSTLFRWSDHVTTLTNSTNSNTTTTIIDQPIQVPVYVFSTQNNTETNNQMNFYFTFMTGKDIDSSSSRSSSSSSSTSISTSPTPSSNISTSPKASSNHVWSYDTNNNNKMTMDSEEEEVKWLCWEIEAGLDYSSLGGFCFGDLCGVWPYVIIAATAAVILFTAGSLIVYFYLRSTRNGYSHLRQRA